MSNIYETAVEEAACHALASQFENGDTDVATKLNLAKEQLYSRLNRTPSFRRDAEAFHLAEQAYGELVHARSSETQERMVQLQIAVFASLAYVPVVNVHDGDIITPTRLAQEFGRFIEAYQSPMPGSDMPTLQGVFQRDLVQASDWTGIMTARRASSGASGGM